MAWFIRSLEKSSFSRFSYRNAKIDYKVSCIFCMIEGGIKEESSRMKIKKWMAIAIITGCGICFDERVYCRSKYS
jgi:hypothetical protein